MQVTKHYHKLTGLALSLIGLFTIIFSLFVMPIGGSNAQTSPTTATFLPGGLFNTTIKTLATGDTVEYYTGVDTLIQQVVRTWNAPTRVMTGLLSTDISEVPIVGWFDEGILYYYTEADVIYLNTNSSFMFYNIQSGTYIDTSGWDTSSVTTMQNMFNSCSNLTSLDVSKWDTSKVTDMSSMFNNCSSLTSLDVSDWDTSKVTDMSSMFSNCSSLTSLDVSDWNIASVTNMNFMFNGCSSLTSLDVSEWNTRSVTSMYAMFKNCSNLTSLDVSGWDTSIVTIMFEMFSYCSNLTSLDISNWNTSSVTNTYGMFMSCSNLTGLDVSKWDTSSVTTMQNMFSYCSNLTSLDVSNWDTSSVTNMQAMFSYCSNLKTIYVSTGFITNEVTSFTHMFYGDIKLIGGHGTKYNSLYSDKTCAVPDSETQSGYLTYDIAVSFRTTSGVELARQVINVGSSAVAPSITGYNISGYYIDTGLSSTFDFSQELVTYTEVYVDYECATGYVLKNGLCAKMVTATFITGLYFNTEIKSLSSGSPVHNVSDRDSLIQQVVRTGAIPAGVTTGLLSTYNSEAPIIAWYDNGTIYYYSEADVLYLNENSSYMFYYIQSGTYIDTSGWDTSKVMNMSNMFECCYNLLELDAGTWDTSHVTNMANMFSNCRNLIELDVSDWKTSNVTDMASMFSNCRSLIGLNLSGWDTSKVTDMHGMFFYCGSLTGVNVSSRDTSHVTNMANMFSSCSSLIELDVSDWKTSNVTGMASMFSNCSTLTGLNLSNWNTSNVTDMASMFSNCRSLIGLNLSGWDTSNVTNMASMFYGCYNLVDLSLNGWNTSKVTDMHAMFFECSGLTMVNVSNWDTSNVTDMRDMFYYCRSLTGLDVSNWVTSGVTNMIGMFYSCISLVSLDVSKWDTSNVTDMRDMFQGCNSLIGLDVSDWVTSGVINMSHMFHDCSSLTELDVSMWDTSSVTDMSYMFQGCRSLTELDVSNWNTDNVTDMKYMFAYCESLTGLNLSSWNTSNVKYMQLMFFTCSNLTTIYASTGFVTDKVSEGHNMFYWSKKLVGGHGTKWDITIVGQTRAVLDSEIESGYLTYDIVVSYRDNNDTELDRQVINVGSSATAPIINKTGYVVSGWYIDTGYSTLFDFNQSLLKYTKVYVNWVPNTGIEYRVYHYIENANDTGYTLVGLDTLHGQTDGLTQASAKQYTGVTVSGFNQEIIQADGSTVVNIYYNRNLYTITIDTDGGSDVGIITGKYGSNIIMPENPTKPGYTFGGWNPEIPTTMPLNGTSVIATWNVIPSGGGGHLKKDRCPDGDNSDSYYDGLCDETHGSVDLCGVDSSPYTNEQKGAYLYAYLKGITTKCPISEASLEEYLRRDEFAKMISVYAIRVVGREPIYGKSGCDKFNDIYYDVPELQNYMKLACELELMGMHADGVTPKDSFDPYSVVTRAEFGTVFSRLLFGDMYNIKNDPEAYKQEGYWYKKHLQALKDYGIMTKIDGDRPKYLERRGRAMLMLQRADYYGVFNGKSPAMNGINALFVKNTETAI